MSIWAKLFGQSNPADSNPADDLGPSAESDGFLMTVEELIAEGRRLQRDCVFLFAHGTGEPAATWHHRPLRDSTHLGDSPWLSIDARYIPGFEAAQAGVLTVFTSDDCETGRIDEVASLPAGLPLYAHPAVVLPPIEAVFALGSERVQAWLDANGWSRTDRYSNGFPDRTLVEAYERQWAQEHPILGQHGDLYAALGGWHLPGADDDWFDLLHERLLAVTVKDSEPWVEAWEASNGRRHVIQRIT